MSAAAAVPILGVAWTHTRRAGHDLAYRVRCLVCHLCVYHDGSERERDLARGIVRSHFVRRHARPGQAMAERYAATLAAATYRATAQLLEPLS